MQVFKTYFKLLNHYKGTIIMFFAVFLTVALVMTGNLSAGGEQEEFEGTKLSIAVIDQDGTQLGTTLKKYFEDSHELQDMEYDEDSILDELYWRKVDYVLIIPKGYTESLLHDDTEKMELQCMKVPGLFEAVYFESELNLYISKLTGLLKSGYTLEEAGETMLSLKKETAKVTMASFVNENRNDACTVFFSYVPYLFITLGISGVGIILLRFNEKEVKDRMECGAMPMKERVAGLSAGIFMFGLILLATVLAIAGILSKGSIYTDVRFPYFLLNMFVMLLFGLSLGFLIGFVAKNNETVNGIVNVVSLALCFLGGVFVPMEFFSDAILKVAKFIPTYWYMKNNEAIGSMTGMSKDLMGDMLPQMGVVAGYALVIFAVTLVVISKKRKRVD
ncbi:MAG: ABC transporter permease [Lachnospiraceae bacterium]|nr:ABC transporter permease [Lachnospiraceae bacterium]